MKFFQFFFKTIIISAMLVLLAAFVFTAKVSRSELSSLFSMVERGNSNSPASLSPLNFFIDSDALNAKQEETLRRFQAELTHSGSNFIVADLRSMEINLYEKGGFLKSFPILSKGRDGSWWETPSGRYTVLNKEDNHFSSIGNVWMPWSMQFYGNFFIHGWPYYSDGTEVPRSYSGGCIRLSTEDAKSVYEFAERGVPILVYDEAPKALAPLLEAGAPVISPTLSATAAIVTDLETGEVLLNKNSDSVLPIASLTKLMTAVIASELVYLDRSVLIKSGMMRDTIQSYPLKVGKAYSAFELLYPLLLQSSNGAGVALASMVGEKGFVAAMNEKARALQMTETEFVDPNGVGSENVASLREFTRLVKYILDKRHFIFDITIGKKQDVFYAGDLAKIQNYNNFVDRPGVVASKNGENKDALETLMFVSEVRDPQNNTHPIFFAILGSNNRIADGEILLSWFKKTYKVQ